MQEKWFQDAVKPLNKQQYLWSEVSSYIVFILWEKILLKFQTSCMCVCFIFNSLSKLEKELLSLQIIAWGIHKN